MRKELIAAASALALMTGAAVAQTPTPAPAEPSVSNSEMSGAASTDAKTTASESASAEELMGKNVYGDNNEKIGEVEDVILSPDGQAQQLVVASGGFLGIGEKQVAVGMDALKFMQDEDGDRYLYTTFTKEQLDAQPAYDEATWETQRDQQRLTSK
jgi:sporulation protein YlmC with PRC-barrel domain